MPQVFSDLSHVKMNATKSMIGHCLGAAGGMEAIATIQAIRTGWVHPTINHVSMLHRSPVLLCQCYFGRERLTAGTNHCIQV